MNEEIEISDRYECVGDTYGGFTVNKIYNVVDIGKFIWFLSDDGKYRYFKNDNYFHQKFKLIAKRP